MGSLKEDVSKSQGTETVIFSQEVAMGKDTKGVEQLPRDNFSDNGVFNNRI